MALSYDLATSSELSLTDGNRAVTITPGIALPPGEELVVSWTDVVGDLCQSAVAPPPWRITVATPSCSPGVGGVVGTAVSRVAVQTPPQTPLYVAADEDPNGFVYIGRPNKLFRAPKAGGNIQDVAALAGLQPRHLGRSMLITGDQLFTVTSPSGLVDVLWRISTDGGATWQREDYAAFPRAPSGTLRGVAENGGRIYMVTSQFSTTTPTEIWSVPFNATTLPVDAVLETSFTGMASCGSLVMDDLFYYLACASGDELARIDRASGAIEIISDTVDVDSTSALHAHDIDGDGRADALYYRGKEQVVSYVCDPAGAPFVDELVRYGNRDFTWGMGFAASTGALWMFEPDSLEWVSIR